MAVYLARHHGVDFFPGVEQAELVFWGTGGTPDGKPAESWMQKGVLPVGIGGGPFDEHYTTGQQERKPYNCAATLMADYMGIRYDPELKDLIKYTLETDEAAVQRPFSIPTIVKVVNLLYNDQPQEVYKWMEIAIKGHVFGRQYQTQSPANYRADKKNAPSFDLAFADFLANFHGHYGTEAVAGLEDAVANYLQAIAGGLRTNPFVWMCTEFPHIDLNKFANDEISKDKKACDCISMLLAKRFGLSDYPAFGQILTYLVEGKRPPPGIASLFELENVLQDVFLLNKGNCHETLKWSRSAIAAKVFGQQYFEDCKLQYQQAQFEKAKVYRRELTLAFIHSDNPMMIQYFRSDHAAETYGRADILVQQSSRGSIQVFADTARRQFNLDDVVRVLRLEELRAKGLTPIHLNGELAKEGLGDDRVFYYFKRASQILNAPLSAPDMPATKLTLDQVKRHIKFAFNQNSFPLGFASFCLKGKCMSTRQRPCVAYPAGLNRCRRIRAHQSKGH